MQTVLCENHLFGSRLFGFSELHLALLGSSRPLPGQFWGADGTQKPPKSDPKMAPKMSPKMDLILGSSWTYFGVILGPSWLSAVRPLEPKMAPNSEIFVFFLQPNISLNSEIFLVDVNTA